MKKTITIAFLIAVNACQFKSTEQATAVANNTAVATIPLCRGVVSLIQIADKDPIFRSGIGNSHLPITTQNKDAQRWFDQGLSHLHGFWHLEAYRAFTQVIKLDSSAAMGYWGLAMCQPGFGEGDTWSKAINKAITLKANTTPIEQGLIDASEILVKEGLGANSIKKFRDLYRKFPDEPEAIAFASIVLRQHENKTTQHEVKTLLEVALKRFPNHVALLHYYLHVMELRPEFAQAKQMAARMIKLAPNSPHLTHMPGHLFYLEGQYDKAITTYKAALAQETAYHKTENIPFSANQNYVHNLHFLAVAQAETANYAAALSTATELANLSINKVIPNQGAALMIHYEGRILPALVHIRFGKWQKSIAYLDGLLHAPIQNPLVKIYLQAMNEYAKGMNTLLTPNGKELAIQAGMKLTKIISEFEQLGTQYQNTPDFKSINETYDIMSMARYELAGWIDNLNPAEGFNDAAWKEAISLQNAIKYDEPPRLMYPIEESLARLHKYRKENVMAKRAIVQALKKRPNSQTIKNI